MKIVRSAAFASMTNTGFTAKPKSSIMLSMPFASEAPNAAAYSSASALLLAMIFCFLVYTVPRARLPRLTISSFLCLQPNLSLRKLSRLNSCSRSSIHVSSEPLQLVFVASGSPISTLFTNLPTSPIWATFGSLISFFFTNFHFS